MSEGGSIKYQLEQLDKLLQEESNRWREAGLPPIQQCYHLGTDQFMHHVHVLALARLLTEELGISQEKCDLMLKTIFLEEMRSSFPHAVEAKRQSIAATMILPPNFNTNNGTP